MTPACVHEQRRTGEVGLPNRPTDRPGYVRLAGPIPNSHAERRLVRRFFFVRISRSPQILLFALSLLHCAKLRLIQAGCRRIYLPRSCFGQLFYTSERGGWGVRTWVVGPGERCSYTAMGLSWQANAETAPVLSLRVYLAILTQARRNSAVLFWATFFENVQNHTRQRCERPRMILIGSLLENPAAWG